MSAIIARLTEIENVCICICKFLFVFAILYYLLRNVLIAQFEKLGFSSSLAFAEILRQVQCTKH